jgi:hypothetical protein
LKIILKYDKIKEKREKSYGGNNCKNIESYKEGTCMVYKCLNYCLDINTIHPYEEFPYSIRSNNEKMKNKKLYS